MNRMLLHGCMKYIITTRDYERRCLYFLSEIPRAAGTRAAEVLRCRGRPMLSGQRRDNLVFAASLSPSESIVPSALPPQLLSVARTTVTGPSGVRHLPALADRPGGEVVSARRWQGSVAKGSRFRLQCPPAKPDKLEQAGTGRSSHAAFGSVCGPQLCPRKI